MSRHSSACLLIAFLGVGLFGGLYIQSNALTPPTATPVWSVHPTNFQIEQITLITNANYNSGSAVALLQTSRPEAIALLEATGTTLINNGVYAPTGLIPSVFQTQAANNHVMVYLSGGKTPSLNIVTNLGHTASIVLAYTTIPEPTVLALGTGTFDYVIIGDHNGYVALYVLGNVP
jgi:hypothetical protein